MRTVATIILTCLLALPSTAFSEGSGMTVKQVRFFSYAAFTRIVFELEQSVPYVLNKSEDGKTVRLSAYGGPVILKSPLPTIHDGVVSGIESKGEGDTAYISIGLDAGAGEVKDFALRGPDRIVIDITKAGSSAPVPPPAAGNLTVVVLDPGHGGQDTGIVTAQGLEKNITLDLALAIKKILQKDARLKPILTRTGDQTVSLNDRALRANTAGAAIFVSIHAAPGSSNRVYIEDLEDNTGVQTTRSPIRDFLSFEAGSEQQQMLWGRQQIAHAPESGVLGRLLAQQLFHRNDAAPLQAPLAELKAVDAAAAMIEIGTEQDRETVAEAVAKGIEEYAGKNR